MRRTGNLLDQIVDRENLRIAFWKASKGHRGTRSAQAFANDLERELETMAAGLFDGGFPWGKGTSFMIHDPKERRITAPCFRERVAHHAIMNVCEPVFEKSLIDDTYACRTGKGSHRALLRAAEFSKGDPFFLKIDVRKYFPSISHDRLLSQLNRLFKDRRVLDLFARIIQSFGGSSGKSSIPGRGLPIGSLMSQHFANTYLGPLDRLVKEGLRVRGYVRYMDDSLIWGKSTDQLGEILGRIEAMMCDRLELELKPSYCNRVDRGIDFLGFRVYPGRLAMNRRGRLRFRRKLQAVESSHDHGEIDDLELQQRATSLIAFTRMAGVSGWNWRRRVIEDLRGLGHRPRLG